MNSVLEEMRRRLASNQLLGVIVVFFMLLTCFDVHANESLDELVNKVIISKGGDIGPMSCGFCSNMEFKKLVTRLPYYMDDISRYLRTSKSDSELYVLGVAAQYLPFEDFVSIQEAIFNEWKASNISDEKFEVLMFRPMVLSRRLMYLHNNPHVKRLMDGIKKESTKRGEETAFNSRFFDKFETGYYRRYGLAHKDQFDVLDSDSIANYDTAEKVKEILLQGIVPFAMFAVILAYFAYLLIRRKKLTLFGDCK